ncbi:MAG: P-loop NTPase fold protein, partial [Chloroflexota bacterium]
MGVGVETDAFAYLISSRTLVPPLAVGLFGEWGSGKSFLMAKIRHRIGQLTELAKSSDHETAGVWGNIAHIEFSAWQYVETNLWAALLHRIFAELTPGARLKLSEKRRAETAAAIDSQAQTVTEAESAVTSLQEEEQKQAGTLQEKRARVGQMQLEYTRIRDAQVAQVLEATARTALVGRTIAASQELLGQDPRTQELASAVAAAGQAAAAARTSPWLNAKFWTPRRVLYVTAATLAVPVLGYLVETWLASAFAAVLASLAALIPLAVRGLKVVVAFAAKQQSDFEAAERTVDE